MKKEIQKRIKALRQRLKLALVNFLFEKLAIRKNKIFFNVFQGDFTCNAKYIALEFLRRELPYDLVWVVNDWKKRKNFPKGIRLVRRGTIPYFYEVLTSKIWIDNAINFFWEQLPKHKDQVLINTWHGSMGLKRIGKDDNKNKLWVERAQRCNTETDFMVSNSTFESDVYKETWWPDVPSLDVGHPRNDVLMNSEIRDEIREKVCKALNVSPKKKLLLYAPTFRDSKNLVPYEIDLKSLKEALTVRFGGEWVIVSRLHHKLARNKKAKSMFRNSEYCVSATEYSDMQELMVAADIGITDYSSWICDFVLTGRPAFIFATDIDQYAGERGFYYPLESTPFPIASSNDQLMSNVRMFDSGLYERKQKQFLLDRGCWESGKAASLVVDNIVQIIEQGK